MAWTTPRTWVAAETITAAQMNTHIRDNLNTTAPAKAAATGDVFYATAANAIAARTIGGPGAALVVNAGGTVPFWGAANHANEFRLTLETGVPVSVSDQTAKTTVYLTPYAGDRIAIWDSGSGWLQLESAQISIAVPATSNTPFDIFAYDNSGTLTLEVLDWTNDTTRATAIVYQDGIYVKSGATGRRYLGTGRTTAVSGQCEDSKSRRFLWSYNNRVPRFLSAKDTTDTWTYTTATWRSANASTAAGVGRFNLIIGVAEVLLQVIHQKNLGNSSLVSFGVGIGINSTSVNSAQFNGGIIVAGGRVGAIGEYKGYPAIGLNFIQALEISTATGTTTWFGDNGSAFTQTGMNGVIDG